MHLKKGKNISEVLGAFFEWLFYVYHEILKRNVSITMKSMRLIVKTENWICLKKIVKMWSQIIHFLINLYAFFAFRSNKKFTWEFETVSIKIRIFFIQHFFCCKVLKIYSDISVINKVFWLHPSIILNTTFMKL